MNGRAKMELLKGRVRSASLPNGFRIFAMRKPGAGAVTAQVWVGTGSVNEGERLGCGLSHFLEHMLFQGTKKYPGLGIADTVQSLGGDVNAYTSHNSTVYYVNLPSKSLPKALDMLSDMVANPTLPKARFKLEKGVILRERDMNLDRPERVLSERLWREMFHVHPVRHPVIGYREKIESVDRDMAAEYHATRYSPARSFLVVVGDVDEDEAVKCATEAFSSWPMGRLDEAVLPEEPPQRARREWSGSFRDPLARVFAAWRIPPLTHRDIPALDMLTNILGGGPSSRLHKKLKTKLELAIDASAFCCATSFEGAAGLSANCRPENMEKLIDAGLDVFRKLGEGGIDEAELERNIAQQSAEYLRGLRSNNGVARILGASVLGFGGPDFADDYVNELSALTVERLAEVAGSYFDEERLTVAKLLPEDYKAAAPSILVPKTAAPSPALRGALSGPRMIHFQDKSLPLVDLCATLPGGLIWEPAKLSGASRLLAACVPCGTKKLSEDALSDLFDELGADFSVIAGNNTISFRLNCRKEALDKAIDAFAQVLAKPAIPERQFERERRNILDAIASRKSSPQGLADDKFHAALYGKHPYGRPSGDEKSIEKLAAAAVREFHMNRCLIPSKAVFGFAGDISKDEAFAKLEKLIAFCDWSPEAEPELPKEPVFPSKAERIVETLAKQQAVLMTGCPACPNAHEDREALELLCAASNGQASKLFKAVREKEGLAYYTGLSFSAGIHSGHLAYYAGTDPKTAKTVDALLDAERKRVVRKGLDKDEFEAARQCLLYEIAEESQNPGRLLFSATLSEFYGIGYESPWRRAAAINALTREQVNQVAAKYLGAEGFVKVLVSPNP